MKSKIVSLEEIAKAKEIERIRKLEEKLILKITKGKRKTKPANDTVLEAIENMQDF